MKEIDADDYLVTLKKEATEKYQKLKDKNVLIKANKTAQYLVSRGFETDLVWDIIKSFK
jgi:regulatory protein